MVYLQAMEPSFHAQHRLLHQQRAVCCAGVSCSHQESKLTLIYTVR